MAKKKKEDLKKDDEDLEADADDQDSDDESNDDDGTPSDDDDTKDDDKDDSDDADADADDDDDKSDDDDDDDMVSSDAYKSLQRTIAKRDKAIKDAEAKKDAIQEELDTLRSTSKKGDVVKADLETRFKEQAKRLDSLEKENKQSKEDSMQSRIIMESYPELAKLKVYIPKSDDEDDYRENCKKFATALGEKITEELVNELDTTTVPVDEKDKKPTQAAVDELYEKAMSLAGDPKKEVEYNKVMDEYLDALEKLK